MTDEPNDIPEAIAGAVTLLNRSERGRQVRQDLCGFLDGAFASADQQTYEACIALIHATRAGYVGSVLDALRH